MTIADQLAERIVAVDFADLSAETVHWAKISILDTIGVALAGSVDAAPRIVARVVCGTGGDEGKSLVLGGRRRVRALDAALINGTAAHALDFDASSSTLAGHPSVHLLPPLLALGEEIGASGKDFITAYVAGYEAQSRLARIANPSHVGRGWFPTGTLGVFGAAAGASRLLGLDRARTAQALSASAMFAAGVMAHAGSMTKPLAAGNAGRNGLLAALAVGEGLSAAPDAIADRRGFLAIYSDADPGAALDGWGVPYDIIETAFGIKQYPCCAVFHSAIDLLAELMAANALSAGDVEQVEALLISTRLGHVDRPDPQSGTDAKFSIQYCLARTLISGRPDFEDFEGEAHDDPEARALMTRIRAGIHPDTGPDIARKDEGGAEVIVTTKDGRRFSQRATKARGWAPGDPLSPEMLEAKFAACAKRALPEDRIGPLLALLDGLETAAHLGELAEALALPEGFAPP